MGVGSGDLLGHNDMKTKIALTIGYIMMAAFTYGYSYNNELKYQTAHYPNWPLSNRDQSVLSGLGCAALWPIYWPFHLSAAMWPNVES
jgi:hypothetical protein